MTSTGIYVNARFLTQPITGVQRFAIEISRQLKKVFPNIIFISPRAIIHETIAAELCVITCGKYKGHIWEQIELPFFLKRNNADILINLANTAPFYFRKNIITVHDLAFKVNPKWFSRSFHLYYNWLIPVICKNALHVFTVSEFSKYEIVKFLNVPIKKISVACNAVSNCFEAEPEEDKSIQFIPDKYILSVGSLDPRKNLGCLIEAFERLPDNKLKLCLVGRKHKVFADDNLLTFIDQNPNIYFFEDLSDKQLARLYHNAQVFVYPSLYEGFGIPILEAMALGCAVIASDIPVFREICSDAAWYFNPYNSSHLSELILTLSKEPEMQQQLKQFGKIRAEKFSWFNSANIYKDVLQKYI